MQTVNDIHLQKKQLRRELLPKRTEFAKSGEKENADSRLYDNILTKLDLQNCKLILTYISLEIEADTRRLTEYAFSHDIPVAAPLCKGNDMEFYLIRSFDDLKVGYFDTYEPKPGCIMADKRLYQHSICIVPGLCFTRDGYRLGYGKGFYDRFLAHYHGLSAGLCYKKFIMDSIPTDKFDLNTDLVITD